MTALAVETGSRRVVFCDMQMPEIDGVQFVRHLVDTNFDSALVLISGEDQCNLQTAERIARGRNLIYQPKVEVGTGKLTGVETLVRWRHPRDGMVLPDHFVPLAEQHGLIDDLTRKLGITTTAESVEDRADWNFLRKARCDLAQGNFIGEPMAGGQLPEWLTDWQECDLAA